MLDCVRVLLIDTCEEVGCVALADGERILAKEFLPAREASARLLPAISGLLEKQEWTLRDLDGVGVVSGPGSFTGVRVGMAAAKGLCEAAELPLVAVSRLLALAEAAGLNEGLAVLDARRGEFYTRAGDGLERLMGKDGLLEMSGTRVVVAEARAMEALEVMEPELYAIKMEHVSPAAVRALTSGTPDTASVDANYVRAEGDIYSKKRTGEQAI
jgi:tRNA threonylcarbamoyladenosine biosynthesis protein TsaB